MSGTLKVEVDWPNTGTWTDITADCDSISINRGRGHEFDQVGPGTLSGSLYNNSGNYSPGAGHPNVKVNRPVRVSVTVASVVTYLFTGNLDSVVTSWDGGRTAVVNIGATDGFKGLARRTMQSFYAESVLQSGMTVTAAFPLSEPSGATAFGSIAPAASPPVAQLLDSKYGAGTFTAGNGAGFLQGAPNATYCTFAFTGSGNAEHMTVIQLGGAPGPAGVSLPRTGNWTIGCWFKLTTPSANATLLYATSGLQQDPALTPTLPPSTMHLYVDTAGKVNFAIGGQAVTSAASYADGVWHYVTASFFTDLKTQQVIVDGVAATFVATSANIYLRGMTWVVAGGRYSNYGESAYGLNGSLANIGFYIGTDTTLNNSIRWLYGRQMYYLNNDTGSWVTDIAQLAGYNQFAAPLVVADTGMTAAVAPFDTTGKTFLDALQTVAKTEQGLLFMRGDGALIFRSRLASMNRTSAFSLNAAAQDVTADFQVGIDDGLLLNDYAVTRPGGAVIRVRDTGTSVADYGVYTNSPDDSGAELLQLTSDNELADYANFRIGRLAQPIPRTPTVTIDLKRASDLWSVAALAEIGVQFTVSGLPAEAPSTSMDFVIESLSWDFSGRSDTCTLTLNTAPADPSLYATLDDPVYGLLDSMVFAY
ncbi:MAG: LamG-like jellyroll fold domain-containing protein [Jatrophihabitantaceae bacterium]